jgi:predicted MPP superfamily phosphohydrolase
MIPQYGKAFFAHKPYFIYTLSVLALFISIYAVWNTQNIKIKHYYLSSDKNVLARIAFLSDLHIAPHNMSVAKLRDIFDKLKPLNPDYVILGGDVIEMQPDYFMERPIIGIFQDFNTQNTVLSIIGNHEYYGGQVHDNISAMQDAGIIVLKDEVRLIPDKNIAFIGRDDKTNPHRLGLHRLMTDIPETMYRIVLDHNPASIMESASEKADLQISGHTHNGQLFPFNFLVKYLFPNAYGYRKIKNTDTVVSSGIGTWGPLIRVGTQSELVVIDINKQ